MILISLVIMLRLGVSEEESLSEQQQWSGGWRRSDVCGKDVDGVLSRYVC